MSPVVGAVEKRAPLLEFAHAVGRFLRVKFGHSPIVQVLSAEHRVFEMRPPIIGFIHVAHCCGDAAFGHYGVGFAEQGFANDADARALRERFERGAKSGAARADDEHVVFVRFVFVVASAVTGVECP